MIVVILGYTGSIGSSILDSLVKNTSLKLICVGRNIKKKPYKKKKIRYVKWDFNSFKSSDLLFLKKANVIINCTGKGDNNINDLENINVIFVKKLLKYIYTYKLKVRLVHLGSVAVYGESKNYLGRYKLITENSVIKINNLYSKSKLKGDLLIKNINKKNLNKNFSFTILRISNVFGGRKKSNLLKFIIFSLKFGFWIKSHNEILFNFVNIKDVSQAVMLVISNLKVSKNKTYIVSDDCKQNQLYKNYQNFYKKKIIITHIPIILIKFLIYFLPLPKKLISFISIISSRVSYSNKKIIKELNFNPKFSIVKKIKYLNE